jgi:hypothetical protein
LLCWLAIQGVTMNIEQVLLEILKNATEPIFWSTENIKEVADAIEIATKERIYFKQVSERRFEVWVKKDVADLQEADLKQIKEKGTSYQQL